MIKPCLYWVGSKNKILDKIFDKFPKYIRTYHEPFLGGGSVLFELLNKLESNLIKVEEIQVSDINEHLINFYKSLKYDLKSLIDELKHLEHNFHSAKLNKMQSRYKYNIDIDKEVEYYIAQGRHHVYYYYREIFNKCTLSNIKRAAIFFFLNKTGFRGMYREGPKGFNVPFGRSYVIFYYDQLVNISKMLNKYMVNFSCKSFVHVKCSSSDDFVYLDPPYFPIKKKSFTTYKVDGFKNGHKRVEDLCEYLNNNNIKFLLSNSYCTYNTIVYKKFNIYKIPCRHGLKAKIQSALVYEIIISN